jgi:hypothetical protein
MNPTANTTIHPAGDNSLKCGRGDRDDSGMVVLAAGDVSGAFPGSRLSAVSETQAGTKAAAFPPPATPGGKAAYPVELGQPGAAHRPGASLRERYAAMAETAWFRAAYEGRSLGESMDIEGGGVGGVKLSLEVLRAWQYGRGAA